MERTPKASIIVPYLNRPEHLSNTLRSLDQQTWRPEDYEIIVIDDGSTERFDRQLSSLGLAHPVQYRYFDRTADSCAALARNRGLEMARGQLCVFVDCDLIVCRDFIENHVRLFEASGCDVLQIGLRDYLREGWSTPHSSSGADVDALLSAQVEDTDERTDIFARYSDNLAALEGAWHLVFSHNIAAPTNILRELGGFETGFKGWGLEDCELGYRFYKRGVPIILNPSVRAFHQPDSTPTKSAHYAEWMKNLDFFISRHPDFEVTAQCLFQNFFDPVRRKAQGREDRPVWSAMFVAFETVLRGQRSPRTEMRGTWTLKRPSLAAVEAALANYRDLTVRVVCKKRDFALIAAVQTHVQRARLELLIYDN